ncbi:MAG: type II toxin-antitoxin system PemK/MazF family toxin [Paucimonas sp.]|jgi:mRNA-degrading endonuclease toxin of MazEF toxin-antitoxin module|nr:type II toxin-antitoxin system PemK/MazF family toxin [Paucimonas sp.]
MAIRLDQKNVGTLEVGDIIMLDLDPTVGHEQQNFRPCIVLSVAPWNAVTRGFVFVLPLTRTVSPNPNATYPRLEESQNDAGVSGTVLLDQMRSLDALGRNGKLVGKVTDQQLIDDLRMAVCQIIGVGADFFPIEDEE